MVASEWVSETIFVESIEGALGQRSRTCRTLKWEIRNCGVPLHRNDYNDDNVGGGVGGCNSKNTAADNSNREKIDNYGVARKGNKAH